MQIAQAARAKAAAQAVALAALAACALGGDAEAANISSSLVNTIDTSRWAPPSPDPSGLSYDSQRGRLVVTDGEVDEMSLYDGANYYESTLAGVKTRSTNTLSFSDEPVGVATSAFGGKMFFCDDDQQRVWQATLGVNNEFDRTDAVTSFSASALGVSDPEALSYDAASNRLFIGDGSDAELVTVRSTNALFGDADDTVTRFSMRNFGISDPETVEYSSETGTLFAIGSGGSEVVEMTTSGTLVNEINVSFLPLMHAAGMAYAPRSNDSSRRSLYIADRKVDNNDNASENDGAIYEVTVPNPSGSPPPPPPPPPPPAPGDVRISAGSDDAEESATGSVSTSGSDLELVEDGSVQTVGLRFSSLPIPVGSRITKAHVQFTADESHSAATDLRIFAQDADNAATFSGSSRNISSRPRTDASVSWAPPAWTAGQADAAQRTPDLTALVQEVVDRPGWASGRPLGLIVTGSGRRTAVAADASAAEAPLIHVEWTPPSGNIAPRVDAGPDQTITLPAGAALDGTVADDGKLKATPTTTWSVESGPGPVSFANAAAVDTQATFTTPGTYVLKLRADDGGMSTSDQMTVVVKPVPPPGLDARVAANSDDAEESASGNVSTTNSDLELVQDSSTQTVGVRFAGLGIPAGATITSAHVQFTADESHSGATTLQLWAQDADNASTFSNTKGGISGRPRTDASVTWAPAAWTAGQEGEAQRTPDVSALVQEVIDRPGWNSGQALALIVGGSGRRTAVARDSSAGQAPLLHVEWRAPSGNQAPRVDAGPDQTVTLPAGAALDGTVSDDGQPSADLTTRWSVESGVGLVVFDDASATDTTARFNAAGTYELKLTADDGAATSSDTVTVVVHPTPPPTAERRIAASSDDAEESASGAVDLNSSDLELVQDSSAQTVGLRFPALDIPAGADVTTAYVQFRADESQSGATSLQLWAQAADDAATFSSASRDISSRPRTSASATWAPAAWTAGQEESAQRTPDLSALVQEIVDRPGWASGNSMALVVAGSGHRTAVAQDGTAGQAPLLHVEWEATAP